MTAKESLYYSQWCQSLSVLTFSLLSLSAVGMFFTQAIDLLDFLLIECMGWGGSISFICIGGMLVINAESHE
jgi:hypothetical protein